VHDFFDILGVSRGARAAEIRRACSRRVFRSHPDVHDAARPASGRAVWSARIRHLATTAPLDRDAAIRFARVGPLVDRMRSTFFGDRSGCPSVDVHVTPWQIRAHAPLTVEVPLPESCGGCLGRGEVADELCPVCVGSGVTTQPQPLRVPMPRRLQHGVPFDIDVTSASSFRPVARLRVILET
jgi:hypothetical protein